MLQRFIQSPSTQNSQKLCPQMKCTEGRANSLPHQSQFFWSKFLACVFIKRMSSRIASIRSVIYLTPFFSTSPFLFSSPSCFDLITLYQSFSFLMRKGLKTSNLRFFFGAKISRTSKGERILFSPMCSRDLLRYVSLFYESFRSLK